MVGVATKRHEAEPVVDQEEPGENGLPGPARTTAGSTGEVLEAADGLLAGFYEAVFRAYVRRCRGEGDGPRPEPPFSLLPFMRFKPEKAARQPQVRAALREAFARDASLRELCETGSGARPSLPDVLECVRRGDERGLAQLVSRAALMCFDGWEAVVWAGAAAAASHARALEDATAAEQSRASAREQKDARRLAKVEKARDKAIAEAGKAAEEVSSMRAQRNELQRSATRLEREKDEATGDAAASRTRLEEVEGRNVSLRSALDDARRKRREMAESFARERASLQERIRRLEATRIPDLDGPARAIEAIASQLRTTQAEMEASPEANASGAPQVKRRPRSVDHPPGMRPGSKDALRWALGQRDMIVLVDAYNVILEYERGWPQLRGTDQRRLLLSRCERMLPPDGAEMWIVFDSSVPYDRLPARQHPRVRHEFTRDMTADDRLVEMTETLGPGLCAYAVTSDRELRERLERRGVPAVPSEVFLEVAEAPRR